ncbi:MULTISPECIES: hypothetical protein [Bacillaceae]|uniref:Uncharacterized protein n=1 Tax=Terrilactibacillus tamarindi TaxID=2599694 RepID=A0A6N8CNF5_9BACI|nr:MULTISPECIES: hypothetical protein [Bacillaceae]AQX53045.1 hypothetical protein BC359_01235 [Priestia flexa]MDH2882509.1 hypothetical protein [Bacillus cytotoxicus]MTT31100.1 hypothetical protein [Terrilactibacillus tamarindi]
MRKYDELKKKKEDAISDIKIRTNNIQKLGTESKRVAEISKNVNIIITNLDRQFEQATKLDGIDITFLFFATALQCVRQYIIGTITQRTDDKTAAKKIKGNEKEQSNRSHQLYKPSLEEIFTNPVPFDAMFGSKDFNLGIGGGFTHRAKTLGHDPILGWIFGTMNIATSTMTVAGLGLPKSYHIKTGKTARGDARDKIHSNADTLKVFAYSKSKLMDEGKKGKEIIGASLIKEALHLKSDLYSTASLPLPLISPISVEFARKLATYGLDMGNTLKVGNQAGYAVLINSLVAMIHGLFYDESKYSSWNMFSVKTRKILSYSNVLATTSNVIAVAIASGIGVFTENPEMVKKSLNYLDIGGILVTIYRLVNDHKFIEEVKQEFLEQEFYNIVMGES